MSMLSRFATLGGLPGDPYWANVSLLLQGGTLSDSSSPVKTITNNGSVTVSTTQYKWSPGSLSFSGTGPTYLSTPNSSYFNLSGAPYTIELWCRPNGTYTNYNTIIAKRVLNSADSSWEIYLNINTGNISFFANNTNYTSPTTPTANTWVFIAVVYDGTNINVYYDGNRIISSAMGNNNNTADVVIGCYPTGNEQFLGFLDDVRITKGIARYSGATCPIPTAPFPTYGP